jgi:pyruvate,water dikinase
LPSSTASRISAEFLVACGIDSMSVSPDSFIAVKKHVAAAEAARKTPQICRASRPS